MKVPKVPGWYWLKVETGSLCVFQVHKVDDKLVITAGANTFNVNVPVEMVIGEWDGPIPVPPALASLGQKVEKKS
jgi:hypothetical protein